MKKLLQRSLLFATICSAFAFCQIPTQGLVACYPFSGNANDVSANGNNLTIFGAAQLTADRFGTPNSAYYFDKKTAYMQCVKQTTAFDFGAGDFTIGAWIANTDSSGLNCDGDEARNEIIVKGDAYNSGFALGVICNRVGGYVGSTGRTGWSETGPIVTGNGWHHVALIRKSGVVNVYVDFVSINSYSYTGTVTTPDTLTIGRHGFKPSHWYEGKIDDIMLYNRALSPQELFDAGVGITKRIVLIPIPDSYNTTPTFSWRKASGVTGYLLSVDTVDGVVHPFFQATSSDTSFTMTNPLRPGKYFWKVTGGALSSVVGSFTVFEYGVPVLIPIVPKVSKNYRPAFCWYQIKGASSYTLNVSKDLSFSILALSAQLKDTTFTPVTDLAPGAYYWRVQSNLSTKWSTVDQFSLVVDSIPVLVRFNGAATTQRRPVFKWHKIPGISTFTIYITPASGPSFMTPVQDTQFVPLADLPLGFTIWRVCTGTSGLNCSISDAVQINPSGVIDKADKDRKSFYAIHRSGKGCGLQVYGQDPVIVSVYNLYGRLLARKSLREGTYADILPEKIRSGSYLLTINRAGIGEKHVEMVTVY
jgi:hypothetical protein